jgi:Transposase DDE domain group 1
LDWLPAIDGDREHRNQARLELALIGIDLLTWTRTLLLDGEHALAEPRKLRYRLLHVAARLVRTARRTILRIARTWPWARELAAGSSDLGPAVTTQLAAVCVGRVIECSVTPPDSRQSLSGSSGRAGFHESSAYLA